MSRTLERPRPSKPRTPSTAKAKLVVANPADVGEGTLARLGLRMASSGLSAAVIAGMEAMGRRGKLRWWTDLSTKQRGAILLALSFGLQWGARHSRSKGQHQRCAAMEAAAISAWTLAIVYLVGGAPSDAKGQELKGLGALTAEDLDALDVQIDADVSAAVEKIKALRDQAVADAGGEQGDVGGLVTTDQPALEDDALGGLSFYGAEVYADDDDDDIF